MVKRLDNIYPVDITTLKNRYFVLLERLKNAPSGAQKYKAYITPYDASITRVYTFMGHYSGEIAESEYIVNYMENEIYKTEG